MKRLFASAIGTGLALTLSACGGVLQNTYSSCAVQFNQSTTGDGAALDGGGVELAQSFVLTSDASPPSVQVQLLGAGTLTGNLILKIEASVSGQPSDIPLATATLDASQVSTTAANWYKFSFTTAPALTKSTTYWIRLKGPNLSVSNNIFWIGNDQNAYSNGSVLFFTGGSWSSVLGSSLDLLFLVGC